jgi:hypothetical protein
MFLAVDQPISYRTGTGRGTQRPIPACPAGGLLSASRRYQMLPSAVMVTSPRFMDG